MKYLLFELFSGVGFCNQLFSLELAIYLASISKRKLILIIRHPLCHIGAASWDYGNVMNFFSNEYLNYLENGIEIHYKIIPSHINELIASKKTMKNVFNNRFSQLAIIDKNVFESYNSDLSHPNIVDFAFHRTIHIFDLDSWTADYVYVNESNASRCLYNFLTTEENYNLMSNICYSLTKLKDEFYNVYEELSLPQNYMSFHFRFGDRKYSKEQIDNNARHKYPNILKLVENYSTSDKILVMADRKDCFILDKLREKYQITLTNELVDNIPIEKIKTQFPNISRLEVIKFMIEKLICHDSSVFVGYHCSTVSNHIQYMHYLNNKRHDLYTEKITSYENFVYGWKTNKICGASLSFRCFFKDNIKLGNLNRTNTKLITLTNDGYLQLTDNLLISMKKIGIENALKVYCIGDKCYEYFKKNYPLNEIELIDTHDERLTSWVEYRALQNPDEEGKKLWANITSYKMYVLNNELKKGNNVIFTDGDIVFERNPLPYIYDSIHNECELIIQNDEQSDTRPNMCTGFFWIKSNQNTIDITDFRNIQENISHFQNDQQYLRRFARKLNHKYLSLDLFPNGKYFRDIQPKTPFIIHFNYDVSEHKVRRMKIFKKWYIDERDALINKQIEYEEIKDPINKFMLSKNITLRQGYITDTETYKNELTTFLKSNIDVNKIQSILEIGFLAGHSAEFFLKLNKSLHVTSIDMAALLSVNAGKTYIDTHYKNRHTLVKGLSQDMLPNFIGSEFDIILIDGSYHEKEVREDLLKCVEIASQHTLIIMNNVTTLKALKRSWTESPTKVWNEFITKKKIQEKFKLDVSVGKGFAIGKIV
jgi:predicted O-methyltransferase YrrM